MDFFLRYKKIFELAGFLLLSILIGYFIYSFFFKPSLPSTGNETTSTATPSGQFPQAKPGTQISTTSSGKVLETGLPINETIASPVANGGLTVTTELSKNNTLGATLSADGNNVQYYDITDGKFYRIDKDGEVEVLSDQVFHEVEKVTWSPNRNEAVLEYPDGANVIYDFENKKQITLPQHWKDFNYSPTGEQIVLKSIGLDPGNRWLAVANKDGSRVQAIESMGENADSVYTDWSPNNQMIAMYTEGVDFNRQEVYFIGMNNENFKSTIVEGRGFQPKWTSDGDRLAYSVYSTESNMKPELWIVDAAGDSVGANRRRLNLQTWAEKCTFASNVEMYCAVPENLPDNAGLFPELAKNTKDNLYKINIETGTKKLIAVPEGSHNMSNIIVSDNGYNLFFTDNSNQKLYKIKLK